ncbi:MAG: hypothetical protein PHG00_16825 [Methylococcales bacterium]|nr:hypothetical protein [Methylococcales bacterium]
MKILVYRRNHKGDPNNATKTFGINDCMGRVRDWEYDAVIGIGASKLWPGSEGIKEKITWVGFGITKAHKRNATNEDVARMKKDNPNFSGFRGQLVTFETEKFILWDENGKSLEDDYPILYKYMFEDRKIPRAAKNFPDDIQKVLEEIVTMAKMEIENATQSSSSKATTTDNAADSKCISSSGKKHKGCA